MENTEERDWHKEMHVLAMKIYTTALELRPVFADENGNLSLKLGDFIPAIKQNKGWINIWLSDGLFEVSMNKLVNGKDFRFKATMSDGENLSFRKSDYNDFKNLGDYGFPALWNCVLYFGIDNIVKHRVTGLQNLNLELHKEIEKNNELLYQIYQTFKIE